MHRTVEIAWLPPTPNQWAIFSSARLEAASLWKALVTRHQRIRRLHWKWPSAERWFRWARGKFPHLSAQSTQQTIQEFLEVVRGTTAKRKAGDTNAKYPWRTPRYRDVTYTNQDAKIRGRYLLLPHGRKGKGTLTVRLPKDFAPPGRLMEVSLQYGSVRLVFSQPDPEPSQNLPVVVGVDLGVNSLLTATDGQTAVQVSGREIKSFVRYRNKQVAELDAKISKTTRGSNRYKKLKRAKYQLLDRTHRKIKDAMHKATRAVVDAFPCATFVVGEPFNDAAQRVDRVRAQQVSSSCGRRVIKQLAYKGRGARTVPEPHTSRTCPSCGQQQKVGRVYRCGSCGWEAPRDVVGALNILQLGTAGALSARPGVQVPTVRYERPVKYPGASQVVRAEPPLVPETVPVAQGA